MGTEDHVQSALSWTATFVLLNGVNLALNSDSKLTEDEAAFMSTFRYLVLVVHRLQLPQRTGIDNVDFSALDVVRIRS